MNNNYQLFVILSDMIPVFQEKAINLCAKWEKLQESTNTGYSDVEMQKNLQTMVSLQYLISMHV